MQLGENSFKKGLRERRPQVGLWQSLASPYAAEICANLGYDWLLFDGEHAPNTVPTLLSQLQAVAPYPSHPVARVPVGETWIIKQYLDIGFTTLLVPLVDTPEQARELVAAVRYAPSGKRGMAVGAIRAGRWGRVRDYAARADNEVCLLVQAETETALSHLDAIAAIEGVDGIFIGPSDLSASMGHPGNAGHPRVQGAIDQAIARIKDAGKAPGILCTEEAAARDYFSKGCVFVAVASDIGLIMRGGSELRSRFKDIA